MNGYFYIPEITEPFFSEDEPTESDMAMARQGDMTIIRMSDRFVLCGDAGDWRAIAVAVKRSDPSGDFHYHK